MSILIASTSCSSLPTEKETKTESVGTASFDDSNNIASKSSDTVFVPSEVVNKKNCFIIVSKQELYLYVCEVLNGDTLKRVRYPVCVGQNKGQKQIKGDKRTPESTVANPFYISEIVDASNWCHDFGDGRGSILAYGNWFMRLVTPGFSGIGIHGSTNNEESVPGRGSEGCIRLRNDDLDDLKNKYAFVGMNVVVETDKKIISF